MSQVICISKAGQLTPQFGGVKFFSSAVGRISEEITDEQAEEFMKTPTHFRMHTGEPIEAAKKGGKPGRPPVKPEDPSARLEQTQQPGF